MTPSRRASSATARTRDSSGSIPVGTSSQPRRFAIAWAAASFSAAVDSPIQAVTSRRQMRAIT